MDIITSPRHTRQSFLNRTQCARSLAYSLHDSLAPEEASSPALPEPAGFLSLLANHLEHEIKNQRASSAVENVNFQNLLAEIRRRTRHPVKKHLAKPLSWGSIADISFTEPNRSPEKKRSFVQNEAPPVNSNIEILPDGQRLQSFKNGSLIVKNSLGMVIEVRSAYGDCLFLDYGSFGQLKGFTRLSDKGATHSVCKQDKHGVTVRDKEGRVRAFGESMTVDPIGRFYLHNSDGQYFCLDLIGGTHSERRRIKHVSGQVDYITAVFTHDGFRMATLYASRLGAGYEKQQRRGPERSITYRFYGRDGTLLEFSNEEALKQKQPSLSLPPGTRTLDRAWLKHSQAQTAWSSLHEYLQQQS